MAKTWTSVINDMFGALQHPDALTPDISTEEIVRTVDKVMTSVAGDKSWLSDHMTEVAPGGITSGVSFDSVTTYPGTVRTGGVTSPPPPIAWRPLPPSRHETTPLPTTEEIERAQRRAARERQHELRQQALFDAWRIAPEIVTDGGSDFARAVRGRNVKNPTDMGSEIYAMEGLSELMHRCNWPASLKGAYHTLKVERINSLVRTWGSDSYTGNNFDDDKLDLLEAVRRTAAVEKDIPALEAEVEAARVKAAKPIVSDPVELSPELVESLIEEANRGFGSAAVGVW